VHIPSHNTGIEVCELDDRRFRSWMDKNGWPKSRFSAAAAAAAAAAAPVAEAEQTEAPPHPPAPPPATAAETQLEAGVENVDDVAAVTAEVVADAAPA